MVGLKWNFLIYLIHEEIYKTIFYGDKSFLFFPSKSADL